MTPYIYINGDSYSAEHSSTTVYSQQLAFKLKIPVVNDAMVGSSNDRIFRTTIEHLASLDNGTKPYVIIGFSFFTREEVWMEEIGPYQHRIRDFKLSKFITLDWLSGKDLSEDLKHAIIDQNINKQVIHFYTKLFMLIQTLKGLSIPYLIFSAGNNSDFRNLNWDSLKSLQLYDSILKDPNVINFSTFNIPAWAQQNNVATTPTGHLLANGHEAFANFLIEKLHLSCGSM